MGLNTVGTADTLLGDVARHRRDASVAAARQYAAAARLVRELDADLAANELAPALKMALGAADGLVRDAVLLESLPRVTALLACGAIDEYRALTIARGLDAALDAADPRWRAIEAAVCRPAPWLTAGQIRRLIERLVIEVDPDAAHEEHEKARRGRGVACHPDPHGMATIIARVPGVDAAIIMTTLHAMADAAKASGADEGRTRDQLLADALTELCRAVADGRPITLLPVPEEPNDVEPDGNLVPADLVDGGHAASEAAAGPMPTPDAPPPCLPRTVPDVWHPLGLGRRQGARIRLVLHADAGTLLGGNDLPAELIGAGAITAQAARELARQCDSADLVVEYRDPPGEGPPGERPPDPAGVPCAVEAHVHADPFRRRREPLPEHRPGHTHDPHAGQYRARQALLRHLAARYQTCRAPGCCRPADRCEAEHVHPFGKGGKTCRCNMIPLCKRHHQLKTLGGWTYTLHPDGSITWTTRTGRTFWVPPPDDPGRPTGARSDVVGE